MNAMKFTGKAIALCFAAGITAAALCACEDKKTDEPAQNSAPTVEQAVEADLDMKPATEAEILEIFAFLPDPVATVDGEPIARKEIIDDIVSQELPVSFLVDTIGEEGLRQAMTKQIFIFLEWTAAA